MSNPPINVKGIEVLRDVSEIGIRQIAVRVDCEITKFMTPLQALQLAWSLIRAVRETAKPHKRSIVCNIHDDLNAIEGQQKP